MDLIHISSHILFVYLWLCDLSCTIINSDQRLVSSSQIYIFYSVLSIHGDHDKWYLLSIRNHLEDDIPQQVSITQQLIQSSEIPVQLESWNLNRDGRHMDCVNQWNDTTPQNQLFHWYILIVITDSTKINFTHTIHNTYYHYYYDYE